MKPPARGDLIAGVSVALVLVPQSLAYAQLAGLEPVHGLYAAAVAPIAGAVIGSSPYLQSGPTAVTALLTFGALSGLAVPETVHFAALAALLALLVGLVRLVVGLLGAGPVAYLMSQPVVTSFTTAAAVLIVCSQVPALLGVAVDTANPAMGALQALVHPGSWRLDDLVIGLGAVVIVLAGRHVSRLFPGALLTVALGVSGSTLIHYDGVVVGDIPVGLGLHLDLPWAGIGPLIVPALVIAIVGFAEPASIARRYAAEDRTPWNSDREFIGQGMANVASGLVGGLPSGGSLSRTSLNRLGGARTRWSAAITGVTVLALFPVVGLLSALPVAVLAGIVIASVVSLLDVRPLVRYWQWARLQLAVAVATIVATVALAPRVDRGVLVGVATALGVHLWREVHVRVPHELDGQTLHLWPTGVLYFGSAPAVERAVSGLVADHPDLSRIVVHAGGLGRVDLTGALVLRDLAEGVRSYGATVEVRDVGAHALPLLTRVLADVATVSSDGTG